MQVLLIIKVSPDGFYQVGIISRRNKLEHRILLVVGCQPFVASNVEMQFRSWSSHTRPVSEINAMHEFAI